MLFPKFRSRPVLTYGRIGALMMLALLAFYSTSSASLDRGKAGSVRAVAGSADPLGATIALGRLRTFSPLVLPQDPPPVTIATYDATCTTPKTTFNLSETVCLKTTGVQVISPAVRSVTWSNPASFEVQRTDLANSPDDTFTLPQTQSSVIDGVVIDNRGTWTVKVVPTGRSKVQASATFTVKDPDNPAFNLNVYTAANTTDSNVPAGSNLTVETAVTNFGPNDATSVELVQAVPSNATFVSGAQTSGPLTFTCVNPSSGGLGSSNCTVASLPKGDSAKFTFVYLVSSGAPKGTLINSLATVTPNTTVDGELHTPDNSWTARAIVTDNPNATSCAVGCPANITVTATSASGTVVNFSGDIESSGDCGAITSLPASGSLFPVGTTPISVTSNQGASCSFTVTVLDTPAPTIDCADDQTETATGSQTEISVSVDAPTADGTNVIITGVRSDNRNVSDPYPVGTTTITWTATECLDSPDCADPNARRASCTQRIIVTSADAPTISCPTDRSFNATGCETTLTTTQIGTPTATGSNVEVTSRRSDDLELTDPFPAGQTTITWTATDDADRIASCTQRIIITSTGSDTTAPTLTMPADVSVTTTSCSALLDDELGVASADDNCSSSVNITRTGVPTVACPVPGDPNRRCETFVFPAGTTDVVYTATDAAGNTTTGVQHVTVHEDTPPAITAPADANYQCASQVPAANASQATASDNCGSATVTFTEVSNGGNGSATSPLIITRTFTATDASGNHTDAIQTITVVDDTPPTITAPSNKTVNADAGSCSASGVALGTPTTDDNCSVASVTNDAPASFPVGTTTVIWTVTDESGQTATSTQTVTVVDNQNPTIAAPADITLYTGVNATSCSVTVNNMDGTLGTATANDNCPGVTVVRAGGSVFPLGDTIVTYTATDAHGHTASDTQTVTVIDNTPPVVTPPANITLSLPLNSTATSMAVSYPNPATATDNCAGAITLNYSPASGSIFPVGATTVTVTATDAHGNSASATFTVTVLYNFTGFFSPVSNLPTLNVVNAGRAIPVKFSLSGNKGLNIFAAMNPFTVGISCNSSDPAADVTETVTAGDSSLHYAPDQYTYVWKTEGSWAGTCRQLVVTLNDGSVHRANFKFR